METQQLETPTEKVNGHDNDVFIYDESGTIANIVIDNQFRSISAGQPVSWNPFIEKVVNTDKWKITLWAGRHRTVEVANAFNGWCRPTNSNHPTSYYQFSADYDKAKSPSQLNFAFGIVVTFLIFDGREQVEAKLTLYLAQGSNSDNMPWWIGSHVIANEESTKKATLTVHSKDGRNLKILNIESGKGDHAFVIRQQQ